MSFRFRIDGDGRDDALVMGIDGTSRFTLGTQFIGHDIVERSGLISVSDVAGRKAELFFGVVGGTSTNCTVTITAVEFRSFATPALQIQLDGGVLMLTWPSSAPDWELQTAAALVGDEWQTVGVQPSLLGGRYRVSVPSAQAVQFFRLSQAR